MTSSPVCRLCGQEGKLSLSHVVPAFMIRAVEHQKQKGEASLPHVMHLPAHGDVREVQGGSWERKAGVKEYLFCAACELKISGWESYAREFLYGRDPGQPKKQVLSARQIVGTGISPFGQPESVRVCQADYTKFKLFQMSLLYRAVIAPGDWGRRLLLSNRETARLRDMLNRADPGEQADFPCTMMSLDTEHLPLEGVAQTPYGIRQGKTVTNIYVVGGYIWMFEASRWHLTQLSQYALLPPSGEFLLMDAGAEVVAKKLWERVHADDPTFHLREIKCVARGGLALSG